MATIPQQQQQQQQQLPSFMVPRQPPPPSTLPAATVPTKSGNGSGTGSGGSGGGSGGLSLGMFLLGAAALGLVLVKVLTEKFPWEEDSGGGDSGGGNGGGSGCAADDEIRCADGFYAVCDTDKNKWVCREDTLPKPTECPITTKPACGEGKKAECDTKSWTWRCVDEDGGGGGGGGEKPSCSDPPPSSWAGCSELDAMERDLKETCTGDGEWSCAASCKIKPPVTVDCDTEAGEVGFCGAGTDFYWKCAVRDEAPKGACGLETSAPTCTGGIAPVCVEGDDRGFVWECATRDAAAIAREEGLDKVAFSKYGGGMVDIYLHNGIPVYPSIGSACGENSKEKTQWRGGLSDADLGLLNNPRGALINLEQLLFVPFADMDDAGLAVYKNRHGVYCVRVNPCRDSTGKLRGAFRQDVDGESYTGRCECKDGYHGKLCQCKASCNADVADGYGCEC